MSPAEPLMSGATRAYVRDVLRREGINLDSMRVRYFLAEMQAGRQWHPKTVAEIRAALRIAADKIEGLPAARAALPLVGDVLQEDCIG